MVDTQALVGARFRAMGSDCHVLIHGGTDDDLAFAEAEVRRLEALWSRFQPDSEISRLNAADGAPSPVSAETLILLCRAVRAQRLTGGWYDPFIGREIVGLGYDADYGSLAPVTGVAGVVTYSTNASAGSRLDRVIPAAWLGVTGDPRTAQLPPGYDFDPGGIGKGLGADLVTGSLLRRGVAGALVNLGGDLRCRGRQPGDGWEVTIGDPHDADASLEEYVRLSEGAVATSTPLKRTWVGADGREHNHLINPASGQSVEPEVASVSVIAPTGWVAEALCKALLIGGPSIGRPLLERHRAAAIVVTVDGSVVRL